MNIISASVKLSPTYSEQVAESLILDAPPLFGEQMAIDYAVAATHEAFKQAEIKGSDLDLIISMSISPDHISDKTNIMGPRLCHPLQRELGADNAIVFDLHDACWTFALDTARSFMHEMELTHALIVRAECVKGLDAKNASGLAWESGAGVIVLKRSDNDNWECDFTRINSGVETARVELLDPIHRFRGEHRAALYFSPNADFHAYLTDAAQSLAQTFSTAWTPYIEPWDFSAHGTNASAPQLAPYAFPLSLTTQESGYGYDGLITFDPFRMHLGACKVSKS